MSSIIIEKIKNLFSGYFALVMATGALSIGTHLIGMESISKVLLFINILSLILYYGFLPF